MDANLENNALSRILESFALPPEAAGSLSRFTVDDNLQNRIDELATKANEGELTEPESREYSSYVRAGNLVAILQAKLRKSSGVTEPSDGTNG